MRFKHHIFDLAAEVRKTATLDPERTAVIEPSRRGDGWHLERYSYATLAQDVEAVAAGLRAMGIHEGTRTVFMAPPSYQSCALGVALSQVGALFLWIDPSVGYLNVGERLRRIQPEAFVGIPISHAGRTVFGWGPRFRVKKLVVDGVFPGAVSFERLRRTKAEPPRAPNVDPDDPSHVLYTTGSTGPAKPAMYTHRQFSQVYRTA